MDTRTRCHFAFVVVGLLLSCACSSPASPAPPSAATTTSPALPPAPAALEAPEAVEAPVAPEPDAVPPPGALEAPRVSHADRVRAVALLRRGRHAAHDGDHAAALAAFREGLAIDAHDPALLCEAGWAAFQQHDPGARAYLEEGARAMPSRERRAACLYNLGRWFESDADEHPESRDADLTAAAAAYHESIVLRPANAATQARARALASHAASRCPPSPRFPTRDALCEALAREIDSGEQIACNVHVLERNVLGEHAGTLLTIANQTDGIGDWTTAYLALETSHGIDLLAILGDSWDRDCSSGSVEITRVDWHAEPAMLVIELHETGGYSCGASAWDTCMEDAEDESACDDADMDPTEEHTDERVRLVCAFRADRYRCSVAGNSRDGIPATSQLGPLPTSADLDARLVCP